MPIEIVFSESFENVEAAVKASFTDCGFAVSPAPMAPGVQLKAKMGFWLGEKGSGFLTWALPWIFKVETIAVVLSAYQDGTTAVSLREGGVHGASLMQGLAGGGVVGSLVGQAADQERKQQMMSKSLAEVNTKLRERLGARIAYEGPPRSDVPQMPMH